MNDDTQIAAARQTPAPLSPSRSGRRRRVVILLVTIWVLNASDLAFTIMANRIGHFNEMNPLARAILDHPHALTAFKFGAVSFATVVLLLYRDHHWVELACWGLVVVYMLLGLVWFKYWHSHELTDQLDGMLPVLRSAVAIAGLGGG